MTAKYSNDLNWARILPFFLVLMLLAVVVFAHGDEEEMQDHNDAVQSNTLEKFVRDSTLRVILTAAALVLALILFANFNRKKIWAKKNNPVKVTTFVLIVLIVVSASVYTAGVTIYLNAVSHTKGPVHWHADFEVWDCGEKLQMVDPKGISNRVGTELFHTHGDDRIHLEGVIVNIADVSLHNFFHVVGSELGHGTLSYLTSSGLISASDGDLCSGKPGKLQVFVYKVLNPEDHNNWNYVQEKIEHYEDYIISPWSSTPPGDCIIVEFGEDKDKTDKMCNTYKVAINNGYMHGDTDSAAVIQGMVEDHDMHDHETAAESMQSGSALVKHDHLTTFGPGESPHLHSIDITKFDSVKDIAGSAVNIPPPLNRNYPTTVKISLTATEVISEIAPGISYNYWTFDNKIPGPFLRVRVGDTVELTLYNDASSSHNHSIDLHAVTGPGGGAAATQVPPGESRTVRFKVLNPGLFVYHCATPNVPSHMTNGMYGLILVEPEGGLPSVDKEFYVMQGELYTQGKLGDKGFQGFDAQKMIDETPEYVIFNGRVKSLSDNPLKANVGETVRIYFGNGGVSDISSFHVIGEIFDTVYPEASSNPVYNIQTTSVPAGGAAIVDFHLEVPGKYVLVDHALARLERGAWGLLKVDGSENPDVFTPVNK